MTRRPKLKAHIGLTLALVALLTSTVLTEGGCAKLNYKQTATNALQATHLALSSAQDVERQAYAAKAFPGLTDEKHREIAGFFAKAFDAEIKTADALIAWRAGDPPPASVAELQAVTHQTLEAAKAIVPAQAELISKIQVVVEQVAKVVLAFRGGQ